MRPIRFVEYTNTDGVSVWTIERKHWLYGWQEQWDDDLLDNGLYGEAYLLEFDTLDEAREHAMAEGWLPRPPPAPADWHRSSVVEGGK